MITDYVIADYCNDIYNIVVYHISTANDVLIVHTVYIGLIQ